MASGDYEFGIYTDREAAERAVAHLQRLGYTPEEISVAMHGATRAKHFEDTGGSHVSEGTVEGFAIGGGLGAIIAGLAALGGAAAVVGTGGAAAPLVAGPLAAALGGLGVGGAAGGFLGALIGAGIPEHHAARVDEGLDAGGILVGVTPKPEHRNDVRRYFNPDEAFTADTI
jgi:hypothetical protein